ncbi:MAG: MotA/TolQ/ExbB proton channel family protein [Puniceicoccales bacterium]|jgi:biopolymer transport protein ExbB|nr:MotA/TolQ/ExbB proton channel family protein [Puniceicoccales bacterium]
MLPKLVKTAVFAAILTGTAICAALPATSLAQEAAAPAASSSGEVKVEEETLLAKIQHVHPVVLACLFAGSVLMIWFGVDGVIKTTKSRAIPPAQLAQFRELFKQGDYMGAYNYAKGNFSPLSDVIKAGVSYLPDGKAMTEEAMFGEIAKVNGFFMGRVSYLSVIGVCAPMVGLTGTVFGMMNAFATLGSSGVGDPGKLSAAIGEVLVATAMGLLLAIPAFVLYYVLRNRITVILHDVQEAATSLFRKMPYEKFEGYHLGDDEIYAASPNWVAPEEDASLENAPAA